MNFLNMKYALFYYEIFEIEPFFLFSGLGASLFLGLDVNELRGSGVPSLFRTGLPEFEQVQQQLTQNPKFA